MKIVFFSNSCWSVYNFRRNIIIDLIKNGNKIIVISQKDKFSFKLRKLGCKVIFIKFENNTINLFKEFLTLIRLFFILKKIKPNILLNFTIKPLIFGSYISGILGIRTINMITGLGTNFVTYNYLSKIILFLYKIAFKKVDHIFFQNKDDLNLFLKNKLIKKKKTSIIPGSGVSLTYFAYKKAKFNKTIKFVMISRILLEKGVWEYLNAAKKILKKGFICKFKLIGPIIDNNRSAISKNHIKRKIKNYPIKYLGNIEDVRPFIQEANCVVLPSYREGTPRSLLESLSIGRPIITSDATGCKNVVKHGYNGFKCKVKNTNSLFNAMKKFILLSKKQKMQMSKNARILAEKKFNEQIVIKYYLNKIYEKI